MWIKLARKDGYENSIRAFRKQISTRLGMNPSLTAEPLPHAWYVFGFREERALPVGMTEFFFYDDAYETYASSPYNKAYELSTIAPMGEVIHLRSLAIEEEHRNPMLFLRLCAATIEIASNLGARYMTAATCAHYDYILALYERAGMVKLGNFTTNGAPCQLSLLALAAAGRRAQRLQRRRAPGYGADLLREVREARLARARRGNESALEAPDVACELVANCGNMLSVRREHPKGVNTVVLQEMRM